MPSIDLSKENRALLLGWLSVLPLLVWWLGWFPGFMSSDSIDQLGQVDRFEFFNFHPIVHTFSMWIISTVWDHPGAVTFVQVVVLAGLLGFLARRLTQIGVPWWLAVGAAWVTAALPMVGSDHDHHLEGRPLLPGHGVGVRRTDRRREGPRTVLVVAVGTAAAWRRPRAHVGVSRQRQGHRPHRRSGARDRVLAPLADICSFRAAPSPRSGSCCRWRF